MQVAANVKALDDSGFLAQARKAARVDDINEKLEGEMQKLTSLVETLQVSILILNFICRVGLILHHSASLNFKSIFKSLLNLL